KPAEAGWACEVSFAPQGRSRPAEPGACGYSVLSSISIKCWAGFTASLQDGHWPASAGETVWPPQEPVLIAILVALLLTAGPAGSWRPAPGLEGGRYAPTATVLKSGGGTDT